MFTVNATPNKNPIGISTGKYTPYAALTDSRCVDLEPWSDGSTGTHGLLYPVNYATTEQTLINTNISAVQGMSTIDDNSYTASGVKKKILGNYYNNYTALSRVGMIVDELASNGTTVNASTGARSAVEISTDKIFVVYIDSADSSKVKCLVADLTLNGTVTAGSVYTIDNNASCYTPNVIKLGTDKVAVTWGRGNTQYASACTVSGTVVTVGAAATATTNSSTPNGIVKLDTNKFAMAFADNTSADMEIIAATVSGTTTTFGTKATVLAGSGQPMPGGDATQGRNSMQQLDTNKIFLIWAESTTYNYCAITFSGTVPTVGSNSTLSNSSFGTSQATDTVLLDTNKVLVLGGTATVTNAVVITFSGTTATAGPITPALNTASTMYTRSVIYRSTSKVIVACVATISSVTSLFANELTISGTTITKGDTHQTSAFTTTVFAGSLFQTTNYTVALGSISASLAVRVYAVRHGLVDITINGDTFATNAVIPLLGYVGSSITAVGRKIYLSITNKNAFTQSIPLAYVYANVE